MDIYRNILKLIIAIFLAKFLSDLVLMGSYIQVTALFAGIFFIILFPWNLKFTLFSFAAFYPFVFKGNFKFISDPTWIMMIAPVLCILFMIELLSRRQKLFAGRYPWFFAAVGVLTVWAVINYIKNPVLGQQFTGASIQQGGIRSYVRIFTGVATFLCCFWYFRDKQMNVNRWMMIFISLSLVLGIARLITFFTDQYIPFLGDAFEYSTYSKSKGDPTASLRILGLSDAATLGLAFTMSFIHGKKWKFLYTLLIIVLLALIVLSGGRTAFFGSIVALLVYVIILNRKYIFPALIGFILLAGVWVLFDVSVKESKYTRFAGVSKEHIEREEGRLINYMYAISIFLENPIFGKGLGYMEETSIRVTDWRKQWLKTHITEQLTSGGHGSYTSMMMIFGIGGIFFLVVMVFGGIHCAYKMIKNEKIHPEDFKLALFAFIYLLILSIEFVPRGNGYSNMRLWFLAGMLSGLKSREAINNEYRDVSRETEISDS